MTCSLPTHITIFATINFHAVQIIWWRHQMKNFPRYWFLVGGIHRSPMDSPHKGQWRGALMFSLICASTYVQQTIERSVIWDAIVPIVTSQQRHDGNWYSCGVVETSECLNDIKISRKRIITSSKMFVYKCTLGVKDFCASGCENLSVNLSVNLDKHFSNDIGCNVLNLVELNHSHHFPLNKMGDILQTTFSNLFPSVNVFLSCLNLIEFRF